MRSGPNFARNDKLEVHGFPGSGLQEGDAGGNGISGEDDLALVEELAKGDLPDDVKAVLEKLQSNSDE